MIAMLDTEMSGPEAVARLNDIITSLIGGVDVAYDASVAIDISQATRMFRVGTLTGNLTLNFNGTDTDGNVVSLGDAALADLDGKTFFTRFKQDGTGNRLLTLGTGTGLGADLSSVTLSTLAAKTDYLGWVYRHTASKCDLIAYARGYTG